MLTQERLKELLDYDPETGLFTRKTNRPGSPRGSHPGVNNGQGYLTFCVDGKIYKSHRLVFLYMTGEMPKGLVDHVNKVRHDNRWCNLRDSTVSQNCANSKMRVNNTNGFKGIVFKKKYNYWEARIGVNRKRIHLGSFKTKEEAGEAYKQAAIKYFGEFSSYD